MKMSTRTITISGLLAAISSVIMFLELNLPFTPGFLKLDFSDVPALLGALAISPVVGVLVVLVKNLVHLSVTQTGGVGELANFLIGSSFVLSVSLIYSVRKTAGSYIWGALAGIIVMTVCACLFNYYLLLPIYTKFMPMEAIIQMGSKVNAAIDSKLSLVLYGIAPFNVVKSLVNALLAGLLVKYLPKKLF